MQLVDTNRRWISERIYSDFCTVNPCWLGRLVDLNVFAFDFTNRRQEIIAFDRGVNIAGCEVERRQLLGRRLLPLGRALAA